MSEVSMRTELLERKTVMIPTRGPIRNLYDLLRRAEQVASDWGIDTHYDDWAHYDFVVGDTAIGVVFERKALPAPTGGNPAVDTGL